MASQGQELYFKVFLYGADDIHCLLPLAREDLLAIEEYNELNCIVFVAISSCAIIVSRLQKYNFFPIPRTISPKISYSLMRNSRTISTVMMTATAM